MIVTCFVERNQKKIHFNVDFDSDDIRSWSGDFSRIFFILKNLILLKNGFEKLIMFFNT